MAIANSGTLSLGDIQTEFGGTPPTEMEEYYRGSGVPEAPENQNVPTSGTISLSDYYGSSNITFQLSLSFSTTEQTITTGTEDLQQLFSTSAAVTIPDYVNKVSVALAGGGGGGVGAMGNSGGNAGGALGSGGGGGGFAWQNDISVDPLNSNYSISVGYGGSGGVFSTNSNTQGGRALGNPGGLSSINWGTSGSIVANGGLGGGRGTYSNQGGPGGTFSGSGNTNTFGGGSGGQGEFGYGGGGGGAGGYNDRGGNARQDGIAGGGGGGGGGSKTNTSPPFSSFGGQGGGTGISFKGPPGIGGGNAPSGFSFAPNGTLGSYGLGGGGGGAGRMRAFFSNSSSNGSPGGTGRARIMYTGFNSTTMDVSSGTLSIPSNAANRALPNSGSDEVGTITKPGYPEGTVVTINVVTTGVNDNTTLYWDVDFITGTEGNADITPSSSGTMTVTSAAASATFTLGLDFLTESDEEVRVNLRTISPTGTIVKQSDSFLIVNTSNPETVIPTLPSTITEGETLDITFTTQGYSSGTTISWNVTGITAADLDSGSLSGTVTHTESDNTIAQSHSLSWTFAEDYTSVNENLENETFSFNISGATGTGQSVSILDKYYTMTLSMPSNKPFSQILQTTSGTYTTTVPTGATTMSAALIGGGGGGSAGRRSQSCGSGGGGGGLVWINDIPVTAGDTIYYTVGAAGNRQFHNCISTVSVFSPNTPTTYSNFPAECAATLSGPSAGGNSSISTGNETSLTVFAAFNDNQARTVTFDLASLAGLSSVTSVKAVTVGAHGDLGTTTEYIYASWLPSSYQNIFETGGTDSGTTSTWWTGDLDLGSYLSNNILSLTFAPTTAVNVAPGGSSYWWYVEIDLKLNYLAGNTIIAEALGGDPANFHLGGAGGGYSVNASFAQYPHGGATGKSGTDGGTGSSSRFPGGGGGAAGYYGNPNSTSNYDVGGGGTGGRGMFQMYRSDLGNIQLSQVDGFDGAGTSTTTGVGATGSDGQDYPQNIYISGQADDGNLVTIYNSGNASTTQATGGSGGVVQGSGAGGGGGGGGYMGSYSFTSGGSNYGYSYFAQSKGKTGFAGEVSIVFNNGITIYPENKQNSTIGTYVLNEGDSFTVTWEQGPVSTSDTDFYWTLSPTPSANTNGVYDDFTASSGTVTILANQSSVTWTISSVLDYYPDGYETYSLYIYNDAQTVLLAQTDNITYLNSSDSSVTVSYSGGYPLINSKIYIAQGDSTTLTLAQQGTAGLDTGYEVEYRWANLTDSSLISGTLGVTGNFTIGSSMSKTLTFNSGAVNNLYRWNTVLPVSDGLAFEVIPKFVSLVETNGTTQFYEGDTIYISYSSSGSFSSNTVPIEISGSGVTPADFVSGVNAANGTYAYTHAIINATGGYQGQSGSITLDIDYDAFGEGDEIITFSEPSGQSFSVTIKESVYEVTSNTNSIDEDSSVVTIDLTTLGVQSGESIDYRITGVSSADINGASLTGNFSALTDTSRSYNITADLLLEGTETMVFEIGPSGTPYDSVSITINDTSVPTYLLTATSSAITEYNDTTITLTTQGLSNGTNVPYTITGVQAGDVTNSLTGNFTINSNTANVVIDPIFDNSIDGPETLTLSLDNGLDSIDITVNEPTFSLSSSASTVTEGSSWTITLTTTGVPNGITVPYTVSGISSGDLSSGSLTGNFTVNGNTASASFTASNDFTTEGLENFILSCPSNHNPSVTVSIQDTSVPLYNLSRNVSSILVGEAVTFSLQMTGLPNGTTVPYTISGTGVNSTKLSGASLTGVFTSSSTSTNTDTVVLTHSFVTDNYNTDRMLTITLDTPASNGETIPSLSSNCTLSSSIISLSVESGNFEENGANNTIRWTLTSNLPNGTTIPWTLSGTGVTANDFTLGSLTGNFSPSTGTGGDYFDLTATDDDTLEGTETVTLTTGTTPAVSVSKDLLDTSVPRIIWANSTNEIWNETINVTFTAPGYADASYAYTISGSPPFTYSGIVSISSETGSIAITHAFDINDLSLSQRDYSLTIDTDPDNSATTIRLLSNTISSSFSPSSTRNETTSTSGTWNLTTNRFPAGTSLPYQIIHHSGTTNNTDFNISNTGNITVGSLSGNQGSASLSFNVLTDYVLEGTETKRFYINLSASGSSDANGFHYGQLSILDTSIPNVDSMSASSATISETGTSTITFTSVGLANGTTVDFDLGGTASYNVDFSLSGNITNVTSTGGTLTFNNNSATITVSGIVNSDIQMFMTYKSGSTERIYVYNASQDLTTWSAGYVHTLPTPTGGFNTMNDLKFDDDGDRLFIVDNSKDRIFKWNLSTPYDITTATYSTAYFSHYNTHNNPGVQGFWFSDTGTRLWTVDSSLDDIMEYTISAFTPNIQNVAPGEVISISTSSPNMGNSRGIHVRPNGTKAFVLAASSDISGTFTDTIVEWSGNAWNDPNSWTYGNYFATGKTGHEGIFVDYNGNHVYISKDNEINYYYCSTGWDVTTMSFQRTVTVTGSGNEIQGLVMVDIPSDTVTITLPVQTNVIAQISSTVTINN